MTTPLPTYSATLEQIQIGLKRAMDRIEGLRAQAVETDDPPSGGAPVAFPRVVDWTYNQTWPADEHEVSTTWHFDIWIVIALSAGLNRAQTQMNAYLAPVGRRSLKQVIEQDPSLGGIVDYIRLTGGGSYGVADIAGVRCLAASVRAEVEA